MRSTKTNAELTLGGIKFLADGGHADYGKGFIHWCKVWYDDLGDVNATKLASWYRETIRMLYAGPNHYRLADGTSRTCNMTFISDNLLGYRGQQINSPKKEAGYSQSLMRQFLNTKFLNGMPTVWQSILQKVRIPTLPSISASDVEYIDDYVYLPSFSNACSYLDKSNYLLEGPQIPWMSDVNLRLKWRGIPTTENFKHFTDSTDPTIDTSKNVAHGDIWTRSGSGKFMYLSRDYIDKHKITVTMDAADGGGWIRAEVYWLRSLHPDVSDSKWNFGFISYTGRTGNVGIDSAYFGSQEGCLAVCPCFSI